MSEDLQPLLEHIRREGVDKARAEADALIEQAREKAQAIRSDAQAEAESLRESARKDAQDLESRAKDSLQQAGRDLILSLGQQISHLLQRLLRDEIARVMDDKAWVELIVSAVKRHIDEESDIAVWLPRETTESLRNHLLGKIREAAGDRDVAIQSATDNQPGFHLRLAEGRIEHDYSAEAIAGSLARLLRPDLAALMRAEAE